jgi:ADP-ribosylglycohydrolase
LTHPNPVCQEANVILATAIAYAISTGALAHELYRRALDSTIARLPGSEVGEVLLAAGREPPADYEGQAGWVLVALQNAFYQLLNAPDLEAGVVDTISRGGDTDTNAAIAGALLGAVHGRESVPAQWRDRVLTCRPVEGLEGVHRPRPEAFWPVDALLLAEQLLLAGL